MYPRSGSHGRMSARCRGYNEQALGVGGRHHSRLHAPSDALATPRPCFDGGYRQHDAIDAIGRAAFVTAPRLTQDTNSTGRTKTIVPTDPSGRRRPIIGAP
jgi:hypothetical protein